MENYNNNFPADTDFIADGPKKIRGNQEALRTGQIVDAGTVKGLVPGNASGQIPISNGNLNVNLNAEKLQNKTPADFAGVGHSHGVATTSSNGMMANTDKTKLDNIASGAQPNQNAFSNVLVGGTTIQADSSTDVLELVAGANITLAPDATNDKVTISISGKVPSAGNADYATTAGAAPANGGTASTISGTITGNQVNADRGNIGTDLGTAREIRWRNYGNGHTIIDNSKGEYPGGNINSQNAWSATYPTLMGYNGSQTYGVRVDSARVADTAGSAPANGGTSSFSNRLNAMSGPASYKLGYTADSQRTNAGEWGRVVMVYDGNGQTYGVRCDRADYADTAGSVTGMTTHGKQMFTASGIFTVPAGVTQAWISLSGGGGTGGTGSVRYEGGASSRPIEIVTPGGGGGGGAAKIAYSVTGLPSGGNVAVTVGGTGGTSSFGAYVSCSGGGAGGTGGNVGAAGGAGGSGGSGISGGGSIFGAGAGSGYGGGGDGGTRGGGGAGAPGFVLVEW